MGHANENVLILELSSTRLNTPPFELTTLKRALIL